MADELTKERLKEAEAWAREIKRRDTIATLTGSLATSVVALIEEVRRLRSLLADAHTAIESIDDSFGLDEEAHNRFYTACLEMGIDRLTDYQVEWMSQQTEEPYLTWVRLHKQSRESERE
jgi:hypothetical protein